MTAIEVHLSVTGGGKSATAQDIIIWRRLRKTISTFDLFIGMVLKSCFLLMTVSFWHCLFVSLATKELFISYCIVSRIMFISLWLFLIKNFGIMVILHFLEILIVCFLLTCGMRLLWPSPWNGFAAFDVV